MIIKIKYIVMENLRYLNKMVRKIIKNMWVFKEMPQEIIISLWNILDFILPDWVIFAVIRGFFFHIFWKAGKRTALRKGNRITNLGKKFLAGNNFGCNKENLFENGQQISFGDNCAVGFRNTFITNSHAEKGKDNKPTCKPITIGNNVWITTNCTILPGAIIEDNVILSAGSVAKGRLESGWIYLGNPAIKVRKTEGILR
jgi:acetyltransferase-like isoleucine patch superfamily enzyme